MDNKKTSEINVVTKKKLGETQINNSISVEDLDGEKITKVLTINAEPFVDKVENANVEVKINGVVVYDLLVVLENGSISSFTERSPFVATFQSKDLIDKTLLDVKSNVIEINNVSDNSLNFNSVIKFQIFSIDNSTKINCPEERDDIFVKTKDMNYSAFVGLIDYAFQINFDEAKDSRFNKVVFTTSKASIKNVIPSNNYIVANGEVFTTIVYQNEDGIIKSVVKEHEFSEEIELEGVSKDSVCYIESITKEVEVVENVEGKMFNFTIPIQIKGQVFERKNCKAIIDAYSLKNEINLTTTSFEDAIFDNTNQINSSISTTATLDDNIEPINRILAVVPNNITILNQSVTAGKLLLEGIININIIYCFLDEEGSEVLNSFDIDVPYSLNFNLDNLKEKDNVISELTVKDINIKNRLGKELEIFIDFKVNYTVNSSSNSAMVSEVNIGEEKQIQDYAMELYLAQDAESLWDIAKKLNTSVDDLVKQNGELAMPLKGGDKIVSYKQNIVDFD